MVSNAPDSTQFTSDVLIGIFESAGQPISISELHKLLPKVARRTIQRRVAALVLKGTLVAEGAGRATRYRLTATVGEGPAQDFARAALVLSPDSRDIWSYVNQPLERRTPVGYQRDFLERYDPNVTWYLPEPLRLQLRRLGDTGQEKLPAGTYSRAVLNRLLIDLSWASSHLEGNTYTRLDTRELIAHGQAASGKDAFETQMILNHKSAIELLVGAPNEVDFNRYTLLNLHSALSENLLPNPTDEGRLRHHTVEIWQSVYRPPDVPSQIEEFFDLLLGKAAEIRDPFEQSFFAMVHLPYLQPFADVNKRTSRLAANIPLFKANLCPMTFVDVPPDAYSRAVLGIYELTRVELLRDVYVWAYERSTRDYLAIRQTLREPDPLRLKYRAVVKDVVRDVVLRREQDPLDALEEALPIYVAENERSDVRALVIEELRRLHEGVLARYSLRPSQFEAWRSRHQLA